MYNSVMSKFANIVFGKRLKSARKNADMTQQAAADKFGVSLRGYCRWEAGQTEPSFGTLAAISSELGVTSDYLLGLSDEGPSDE